MAEDANSIPNSSDQDSSALGVAAGFLVGGGRFSLTREIGRGGMSVVWLAQDERLEEHVALKFLPAEVRSNPIALGDMRRETQKSRKLAHPNIVRIYDLYEAPGEPAFISMEYVEGPNLHDLRAEQPNQVFSWEFLQPLVKQLCDALDYAHGEEIIHRDLKPANMMIDAKGRLKLADFGIAAVAAESTTHMSGRFAGTGTVTHMSPQQLDGALSGVSDDIYALGATLYELLTSHPPFYSGDIAHQVRNFAPPPLEERLAELGIHNPVPRDVAAMVMACLSKSIESRPPSARAVAEWIGLAQAQTTSIRAEPATATAREASTTELPATTTERPATTTERSAETAAKSDAGEAGAASKRKSPWIWAAVAMVAALGVGGWFAKDRLFTTSSEPTTVTKPKETNGTAPVAVAPADDTSPSPENTQETAALSFNATGPGSLDTSFDPGIGPNSEVRAIAAQDDGKILVGGSFRTFNNEVTGGLVRLNADGTIDHAQIPQVHGNVHAVIVMPDNKILVGGSFDSVAGIGRRGLARLNSDLTLDRSFDPGDGPNNREVWCMALANGKIYIGGNFQNVSGFHCVRIARLNADGRVDRTFDAGDGANRIVWQVAPLSSGSILIAGAFEGVEGQRHSRIARVFSSGKIDPSFRAGADNMIHAMALQPDGKIVIGGDFSAVDRTPRSRVARLNGDGSLDLTFNPPSINKGIRAMALQNDGKIIVAGIFSEVSGLLRQSIARLNADGSLDQTFIAAISSVVRKVAVQRDEKILVAGAFMGANNLHRHSVARFNSSGTPTKAVAANDGWATLFDGNSVDAWRGYNRAAFPNATWSVEKGELKTTAPATAAERCDLVTKESFRNFELTLEWRASAEANSGIFYRASEGFDRVSQGAPEMQIIGERNEDAKNPITSAGALYGLIAAGNATLKAEGEFNQARIVVRGSRVEHWLNGVKVMACDWDSPETKSAVANTKFKNLPHVLQPEGHIVLQQRSGEVWFRNVRIHRLPDEATTPVGRVPNYASAQFVSIDLGKINRENGLQQIEYAEDGLTAATNQLGRECRQATRMNSHQAYYYLKLDRTFKRDEPMNVRVVVEFCAPSPCLLDVEYDGPARHNSTYTSAGRQRNRPEQAWKTEEFHLKQARFRNSQNGGADFRVRSSGQEIFVHRITLYRE